MTHFGDLMFSEPQALDLEWHTPHNNGFEMPLFDKNHDFGQAFRQRMSSGSVGTKEETSSQSIPVGPPSATSPRTIRHRTTEEEFNLLENFFAHNPRPNAQEKLELVKQTNMTLRMIQIWFQNRRAKAKKLGRSADDLEDDLDDAQTPHGRSSSVWSQSSVTSQTGHGRKLSETFRGASLHDLPARQPGQAASFHHATPRSLNGRAQTEHSRVGVRTHRAAQTSLDERRRPTVAQSAGLENGHKRRMEYGIQSPFKRRGSTQKSSDVTEQDTRGTELSMYRDTPFSPDSVWLSPGPSSMSMTTNDTLYSISKPDSAFSMPIMSPVEGGETADVLLLNDAWDNLQMSPESLIFSAKPKDITTPVATILPDKVMDIVRDLPVHLVNKPATMLPSPLLAVPPSPFRLGAVPSPSGSAFMQHMLSSEYTQHHSGPSPTFSMPSPFRTVHAAF